MCLAKALAVAVAFCQTLACALGLGFVLKTLHITARQYGEVVLPDEASGQGFGTLARNLSRCKEGMARVFAVMVQILLRAGAIAVQVLSELRNYPRLQIW
jgi:hypothetical protein